MQAEETGTPREGTELGRTTETGGGGSGRSRGQSGHLELGTLRTERGTAEQQLPPTVLQSLDVFKQKCLCMFSSHVDGAPCGAFGVAGLGGSPSVEPVYFSSVQWAQDPCLAEELKMQSQ